jgi:hypothetical protein
MATDPKSEKARRVFVLADTHNRLPESVREMAKDADEIWHLGDDSAWVGEKDLACEQLATAVRCPTSGMDLSYGDLKLMPWWDPLRGDPRFEKIVASLAPK